MEQLSIRKIAAWAGGTYDGPDMRVSGEYSGAVTAMTQPRVDVT